MNFDLITKGGYNFNIGKYISDGFELFKKDIGGFIVATILVVIMSIIPFCGLLALGNFYKICRKVDQGQKVQAGDIFDFTDFWVYFKFMLLIFVAIVILMIPIQISLVPMIFAAQYGDGAGDLGSALFAGGMGIWMILFMLLIFAFAISFYFVQPIISLYRVQSVRQAYSLSWKIAKKNFWMILIFSLVVGVISEVGIIACGIGILFTAPIGICIKYASFKDVLETQNQKQGL
ncbi:glycerophosphoryl diester phosphodiesterase membrane domain-containing protein [Chryseobacterium sp. ERMR1:04]|uniref:DUF4013 domain-containing protein n=1 Tax=Chryseobacterium sp. ERMR1:04 TaxID=1705393 RepID=UPI0006C8DA83|nr:glycerophosphoryl diester phosphodiesterase membrane domain-containing protein [Chryseobacterium sp. ERMR1:04]KPH11963.1 hypothetical protein AMQ68_21725 [Chryseobacterium sp. ERMR1:04]